MGPKRIQLASKKAAMKTKTLVDALGGFPIEIETKISKLSTYSLAIL